MPVKRRISKRRAFMLTPEMIARFEAGDRDALYRAMGVFPYTLPSPLDEDLEGPPPYGPPEMCWNQARPRMLEIRKAILSALGKASKNQRPRMNRR